MTRGKTNESAETYLRERREEAAHCQRVRMYPEAALLSNLHLTIKKHKVSENQHELGTCETTRVHHTSGQTPNGTRPVTLSDLYVADGSNATGPQCLSVLAQISLSHNSSRPNCLNQILAALYLSCIPKSPSAICQTFLVKQLT